MKGMKNKVKQTPGCLSRHPAYGTARLRCSSYISGPPSPAAKQSRSWMWWRWCPVLHRCRRHVRLPRHHGFSFAKFCASYKWNHMARVRSRSLVFERCAVCAFPPRRSQAQFPYFPGCTGIRFMFMPLTYTSSYTRGLFVLPRWARSLISPSAAVPKFLQK